MMPDIALHLLLLLVFPPVLSGIINKTKALFAGRVGPPVFQLYYDIFKLLRKGMVLSTTTGWIFTASPFITLSCVLAAGLLIPMADSGAVVSFAGDFLLFAYLFVLARFFTACAALDTGSSFEGMGAAREVTFAFLAETALFFVFLVLVRLTGSLSLSGMLQSGLPQSGLPQSGLPHSGSAAIYPEGSGASLVMIVIGLFIIYLAENSRIPVDDPNTHLELTMIHEVMVLDNSGPLLGVIEYASSVKLFVLGSVLVNIIIPGYSIHQWINWLFFAGGMIALSVAVGIVESVFGRLRMNRVPSLLIAAILICGSSFIMAVR